MPRVRVSPLGPKMQEWLNAIPAFFLLMVRHERSNRNMPVAYCCHQFKNGWLLQPAPFGEDANESRHSDQKSADLEQNQPIFFVYCRPIFDLTHTTLLDAGGVPP